MRRHRLDTRPTHPKPAPRHTVRVLDRHPLPRPHQAVRRAKTKRMNDPPFDSPMVDAHDAYPTCPTLNGWTIHVPTRNNYCVVCGVNLGKLERELRQRL